MITHFKSPRSSSPSKASIRCSTWFSGTSRSDEKDIAPSFQPPSAQSPARRHRLKLRPVRNVMYLRAILTGIKFLHHA